MLEKKTTEQTPPELDPLWFDHPEQRALEAITALETKYGFQAKQEPDALR